MEIKIDDQKFEFAEDSNIRVESGGYDLYIEERGFDKTSEENIGWFTSKTIVLPEHVEVKVRRCVSVAPCSKVYKDANGKKRLYTYFD